MQSTEKDEFALQNADDLNLWALADTLYVQWEGILSKIRARKESFVPGRPSYSDEERAALQTLVANMDSLISNVKGSRHRKLAALRSHIVAELRAQECPVAALNVSDVSTSGDKAKPALIISQV